MSLNLLYSAIVFIENTEGDKIVRASEKLVEIEFKNPNHYDELIRLVEYQWLDQGFWVEEVNKLITILEQKKEELLKQYTEKNLISEIEQTQQ